MTRQLQEDRPVNVSTLVQRPKKLAFIVRSSWSSLPCASLDTVGGIHCACTGTHLLGHLVRLELGLGLDVEDLQMVVCGALDHGCKPEASKQDKGPPESSLLSSVAFSSLLTPAVGL